MSLSRSRMCARFIWLMCMRLCRSSVSLLKMFAINTFITILSVHVCVCVHCSFIFHFSLPHRRQTWRDSVQLIHFLICFSNLWNDVVCNSVCVCVCEFAHARVCRRVSEWETQTFKSSSYCGSYCGTCNLWACLRFYWIVLWVSQDKSQSFCRLFGREWMRWARNQWIVASYTLAIGYLHYCFRAITETVIITIDPNSKIRTDSNHKLIIWTIEVHISMATNGQQQNRVPCQRPKFGKRQ